MRRPWTMGPSSWPAVVLILLCFTKNIVSSTESKSIEESQPQKAKLLPIFSVVRFPNDICEGGSRNGTCYTSEECSNKGGTEDGTCASGFGVCCIFTLSCGGSSSENCTYLVQSSKTTWTANTATVDGDSPCEYTICKVSSNVCRIRYDFSTFTIANPPAGTVVVTSGANLGGTTMGDCSTDSITFTGPGTNVPVICGENAGQHLYVDATDTCHLANFNIGTGDTTTTRQWDIKVTQYLCGSEKGGPPGCLQYFTATTGTVMSFNMITTATITASVTHLSSQDYQMCWRRASSNCLICFTPTVSTSVGVADQQSFGLSVGLSATIGQTSVDATCTADWLELPGANTAAIAAITTSTTGALTRICGRIWAPATTNVVANTVSLCTRWRPFRMRFFTDADEVITITGTGTGTDNEQDTFPGGIIGFKLNFAQTTC